MSNVKLPPRSDLEREIEALMTAPARPLSRANAKKAAAAHYGVTLGAVEQRLHRPEIVPVGGPTSVSLDNAMAVILRHTERTGYPPTLRELADDLGVAVMTARTLALLLAEEGRILYQVKDEGGGGIQLPAATYARLAAVEPAT